jgi:steroid 5-alpha reductase family enzyme
MAISLASLQATVVKLAAAPECVAFVKAVAEISTAAVFTNPATATAALTALIAAGCWIGQVSTGYWSWVDRIVRETKRCRAVVIALNPFPTPQWSLSPVAYAWIFAALSGGDVRLVLMTLLVTAWGTRLTRNFARKGGYGVSACPRALQQASRLPIRRTSLSPPPPYPQAEEDYRWPILRAWFAAHDPFAPLGAQAFSLFFVALYQNILIWAFAVLPFYGAWVHRREVPLNALDLAATAAFLLALYGEHVTDEAQWAFQTAKYALTPAERQKKGGDYARGFCTTGPFAYARHFVS